jgi:Fe-S-cluster containining protein
MGMHLSEAFGAWLPALFEHPLPDERRAACEHCSMCAPAGGDEVLEGRGLFNPAVKCCTYQPALASFAVGALFSDSRPELDEGRRRVRARIAEQHGVYPSGVQGPSAYWLRYRAKPDGFGRAEELRCPYYDAGRCTVWQLRDAVCSTYFCKFDRGVEGKIFYDALRDYLVTLSDVLVVHAMLELGFAPASAAVPASTAVSPDEIEGQPLSEQAYAQRWQHYRGREEEYFRAAHELVSRLGPSEVETLGGARLSARLQQLESAYNELVAPRVPTQLTRNPSLRVINEPTGGYLLEGYSPMDLSRVGPQVYHALDAFDGRPTEDVLASLEAEGKPKPSAGLLRSLYHHRVLVDASKTRR